MKKTGLAAIFFIILIAPVVVSAQVKITEIMYDLSGTDTNREWVEIKNESEDEVKIMTGSSNGSWRLVDSSAHTVNSYVENKDTLEPGEYAVIAKNGIDFTNEWTGFDGVLFTSPLSLTNTDATIFIKDGDGNILDSVTYNSSQGANGDGNSLQKNSSGSWIAATPTPGSSNDGSATNGEVLGATTQTSAQSSASYSSSASTVSASQGNLDVVTGGDRVTSPGSPTTFQATIKKNTVQNTGLKFSWSYGDGNIGEGQSVTHTYKYPGEYVVVLSSRAGSTLLISRFKVKVVEASIAISRNDEYVEIENKTNNEINLFNWKLTSRNMAFIFQSNTIVLPKNSIKIPLELLKMKGQIESHTVLKNSIDVVVAEFIEPMGEEERDALVQTLDKAYLDTILLKQGLDSRNKLVQIDIPVSQFVEKEIPNENTAAALEALEKIENSVDPSVDLGEVLFESSPEKSFVSKIVSFLKSLID